MESSATKKKNSNNNNGPRRTQSSVSNSNSNSSSKRFLLCFKPVHTHPNIEESGRLNRSKTIIGSIDEPLFAYVPMGNTEELPTLMSSASSNSDKSKDKEGDVPRKKKKKKKNIHQMFSKILKTVIPHSSLTKKILLRKDGTKSPIPKGSDKYFNHFELPIYQNGKLLSNASTNSSSQTGTTLSGSSSMSSSNQRSSISSTSTSSNSNEWKDKHDIHVRHIYGKASFDSNNGFCLLFMSLLVLILWGKVCAIFCTSIWLFLVPRYLNGNESTTIKNNLSPLFETEDRCNKTVVMEGLLERTRSHVLQHL